MVEKTHDRKINTDAVDFTFGEIVNLHNDSEIVIQPEYQRLFRWSDEHSNLWPDLLMNILRQLDLDPETIVTDTLKLRTLVARRNDIAHGRKVFVEDLAINLEYENATLDVMYGLALAVVERTGRFGSDENSSPQQDLH